MKISVRLLSSIVAIVLVIAANPSSAGVYRTNLWPSGILPFEFDSNMTGAMQTTAIAAMAEWASVATVSFRARDSFDAAWIHFRDSTNDAIPANYVGFIGIDGLGWGLLQRNVNITTWTEATVVHELGHILGMPHEQNRPDRESFVRSRRTMPSSIYSTSTS